MYVNKNFNTVSNSNRKNIFINFSKFYNFKSKINIGKKYLSELSNDFCFFLSK